MVALLGFAMALRKSPTMILARFEANRRNAQKSTGSHTARGKAQARLSSLRSGAYSRLYIDFVRALPDAPPSVVGEMAPSMLTPELAARPLFIAALEIARQSEIEVGESFCRCFPRVGEKQ